MTELALTRIRTRKLQDQTEENSGPTYARQLVLDIEVSSDDGLTWAVLPTRGGVALHTGKDMPRVETSVALVPTHECFPDFPPDD